MKIIRKKKSKSDAKQVISLRLKEKTIEKSVKLAQDNDISRQKLLESIIEQAISDKNFVLTIQE